MTDWESLVRDHGPAVYATAYRILGHAAESEEAVQDVFLAGWRARHTVRSWPAWLRHVATRRALDRLRRRPPTRPLDNFDRATVVGPEAEVAGRELAEQLRVALAQLPTREAEVFCLRFLDELSNQQIAESLGIEPGAVGVALHRARARLSARLRPFVPGGDQ